jgi:hypothetical protein
VHNQIRGNYELKELYKDTYEENLNRKDDPEYVYKLHQSINLIEGFQETTVSIKNLKKYNYQ